MPELCWPARTEAFSCVAEVPKLPLLVYRPSWAKTFRTPLDLDRSLSPPNPSAYLGNHSGGRPARRQRRFGGIRGVDFSKLASLGGMLSIAPTQQHRRWRPTLR